MAIVRIVVAIVFINVLSLLSNDLDTWFGDSKNSIVSVESARKFLPLFPSISLLTFSEPDHNVLLAVLLCGLFSGAFLLLGWHSRINAVFCFVIMQSLLRRNPFIVSGADELLSQMLFYLALSNAGLAFSLERFLSDRRKKVLPAETAPWAQRLLQIQICLIYLQTFASKIVNPEWQSGTALYNVLRSKELINFLLPDFIYSNEVLCQFLTWSTLGLELLIPLLIWFRPLTLWVIAAAVCMHLSMEYCLNIPFFQALMIAGLATFLKPEQIRQFASRFRLRKANAGSL